MGLKKVNKIDEKIIRLNIDQNNDDSIIDYLIDMTIKFIFK